MNRATTLNANYYYMNLAQQEKLESLVNASAILSPQERTEWLGLLGLMDDRQLGELEKILTTAARPKPVPPPVAAPASIPAAPSQPAESKSQSALPKLSHIMNLPRVTDGAQDVQKPQVVASATSGQSKTAAAGFLARIKSMLKEKELPARASYPADEKTQPVLNIPVPTKQSMSVPAPAIPKPVLPAEVSKHLEKVKPVPPPLAVAKILPPVPAPLPPKPLAVAAKEPPLKPVPPPIPKAPPPVVIPKTDLPKQELKAVSQTAGINLNSSVQSPMAASLGSKPNLAPPPGQIIEALKKTIQNQKPEPAVKQPAPAPQPTPVQPKPRQDVLASIEENLLKNKMASHLQQPSPTPPPATAKPESFAQDAAPGLENLNDLTALEPKILYKQDFNLFVAKVKSLIAKYGYHEVVFNLEQSPLFKNYIVTGNQLLSQQITFEKLAALPQGQNYLTRQQFEKVTDLLTKIQAA